jgi:hypothetical protein
MPRPRLPRFVNRVSAAALVFAASVAAYFVQQAAAQDQVRCYYVVCGRGICSYVEVPCPDKPMEEKPIK